MADYTDERIAAIFRGPFDYKTIPFPGSEGVQIAVRVLSDAETDGCRAEALKEVSRLAKGIGWAPSDFIDADPDGHRRLVERQIIWSAFYDPATVKHEKPKRFFPLPADVAALDTAGVTYLFEAYIEHQQWARPLQTMEEDQAQAFIEALGNERSASAFLLQYDRSTLVRLFISLASALRGSTSPTSK